MSVLTVRAYNVHFGDAILVSVPDRDPRTGRETRRHILIDVGNVLGGPGGQDDVFVPVVRDIRRRLGGRPLDLYVMTHEHLDHVQGLPYAAKQGESLDVEYAWLTASARPGYGKVYKDARRKRRRLEHAYSAIHRHLSANPRAATPSMMALMENNNPWRTRSNVAFLRRLANKHTRYVHRKTRVRHGTHHPFREATLRILAPERDSSIYYGRMRPLPLAGEADGPNEPGPDGTATPTPTPTAPEGVDPEAFARLLESWGTAAASNALAIDRAANNTSVVFELDWRGWRLLFTGDAEGRSWREMERREVLRPAHFLKVGHHGSHNATPPDRILGQILPVQAQDTRRRTALISTCLNTYSGVPHGPTVERLEGRCDEILKTTDLAAGESVHVSFEG